MRLISDWKRTIKRSWSMRFMLLSAVLSGAEVAVPVFSDAFPPKMFTAIAILTTVAAAIARVVYQQRLHDPQ